MPPGIVVLSRGESLGPGERAEAESPLTAAGRPVSSLHSLRGI